MTSSRRGARAVGLGIVLASCNGDPDGTVTLVTGDETDTFSRAPAPTVLIVEKIGEDGKKSQVTQARLPLDTVDLGRLPQADVGAISVTGQDDTGKALVHGESLLVEWGAIAASTLEVFVQRTGELARMPLGPPSMDVTAAALIVGRYVFATSATTASLYDLLTLGTTTALPALPRAPKSLVAINATALLIDDAGGTTLDLDTGEHVNLTAPPGGTFAEVAGGQTVPAIDGTQYLVGATRLGGGATSRILVVGPAGETTFASLVTPREGACATWVEGRGLVVFGGAAGGAGAEVLAKGSTTASPLPFPADAAHGCALAALDGAHLLVAGGAPAGTPSARVLDLGCTTSCTPATWPGDVPLVRAEAGPLAGGAAFVVGDDAAGASHAYRVAAAGVKEIPLRVPRRGARLLPTPTNAYVVFGGAAGIEQYLE